jgi:hypothetical protein
MMAMFVVQQEIQVNRLQLIIVGAGLGVVLAGCTATTSASPVSIQSDTQSDTSTSTSSSSTTPPTPTPVPTPPPTPTPPPAPVVLSGRGDDVVKIPAQYLGKPVLLAATHNGSANFIVEALDSSNQTADVAVNEIGVFRGMVALNFRSGEGVSLKVKADGAWTLTFKSPTTALGFDRSASGHGDEVLLYTGTSGVAAISHRGKANFIVETYGTDGQLDDIPVNEIGNYDGRVPVGAGTLLVAVHADGNWTITVAS